MTASFERIVRPFAAKDVTPSVPSLFPRSAPPGDAVAMSIGKGGDAQTFSYSYHYHAESGDVKGGKFKEIKRTQRTVRVENPDDSDQYVEFKRVEQVTLQRENGDKEKVRYAFRNTDT
jgi:hypothetical protein